MQTGKQQIFLIIFSLFFLIFGVFVVISALRGSVSTKFCISGLSFSKDGDLISEIDGKQCYCTNGKVVCSKVAVDESDKPLVVSDFLRSNLTFEAKYLSTGLSNDLVAKPLGVVFSTINTSRNTVEIVLKQSQLCTAQRDIPTQIGMYNYRKSTLTLLNVINSLESLYTVPCTVSLTYKINGLDVREVSDFKLVYQSEDGQRDIADVCLYNSNVYNNGDNYLAEDSCNVCRCEGGITKCATDRVCGK
ncbi:MAG: hypothetical protein UT34_C0001G0208 [candidate division WS6 bacterium GW2011_GWF2_39_15]|uniref:Uncharacterized protein n=1 Tax=candidate division WS6 bacterium GW2011_GWF2_39_15 TaxID=1619100 RepID=A0A0G0MSQ2_9BACT|nr:MAG: hypothetical protein UT34_C0001G0208 [candidate division WS6 bacterium GW2011_GWF2_39_15]